jgi:hypothetical protein
MKAIMIDLAKNENFEDYKAYINSPASYARKWILAFTKKNNFRGSPIFFHLSPWTVLVIVFVVQGSEDYSYILDNMIHDHCSVCCR